MGKIIRTIAYLIIGIVFFYLIIRILPFLYIEIGIVAVLTLIVWLLKLLAGIRANKKRKAQIKFRADNSCPVCNGKCKLNGKDEFLHVTFDNEDCYACNGLGYAKEIETQQKFKEIKDYNDFLLTCDLQIKKHEENIEKLQHELERGVMSNYEEKKVATQTIINKHSERINFYSELIKNIEMNKTIAYYNLYDRSFSEMLNESIDSLDDDSIEQDTIESIYYSERNQLDNSNLDRINSLLAFLNDKQEISDGFRDEIAQLTKETEQKLNLYNKDTNDELD